MPVLSTELLPGIHFQALHRHSKLLPYQSQSSVDLSLWMLKSFILTSDLNFESILSQQNTSINSQTRGPSTLMVY